MLRARVGLGTVWTTLHLPYEHEVGEALGIPDTVTQLACIPTAFYTGDDFKPASRKPAEAVTYWNSWKQTDITTERVAPPTTVRADSSRFARVPGRDATRPMSLGRSVEDVGGRNATGRGGRR